MIGPTNDRHARIHRRVDAHGVHQAAPAAGREVDDLGRTDESARAVNARLTVAMGGAEETAHDEPPKSIEPVSVSTIAEP